MAAETKARWDRASELCASLRRTPAFATSCVRAIMRQGPTSSIDQDVPLGFEPKAELLRTMAKSSSYKAALYFAARNLYPGQLASKVEPGDLIFVEDLLDCFTPFELASLIPIVYLNRYISIRAADVSWGPANLHLRRDMALARRIATTTNLVGPGQAMLAGALRQLSLGLFAIADSDNYKKMRSGSDKRTGIPSEKSALRFMGVDLYSIAATMSQRFGFGVEFSTSLAQTSEEALQYERLHVLLGAVDHLKSGKAASELPKRFPFFVRYRPQLDDLREYAGRVLKDDGVFRWTNAQKEDLFIITEHKIEDRKPAGYAAVLEEEDKQEFGA